MIHLKDEGGIKPGDIIMVVSNGSDLLTRLKHFVQSLTNRSGKHGHYEVTSVFVCSDTNQYGNIYFNHERQIKFSDRRLKEKIRQLDFSAQLVKLKQYCQVLTLGQFNEIIHGSSHFNPERHAKLLEYFRTSNKQIDLIKQPDDEVFQTIVAALNNQTNREAALVDLLLGCAKKSGESDVFLYANTSLLTFRIQDQDKRKAFIDIYKQQAEITRQYERQKKTRTSFWKLFLAIFQWADKEETDRDQKRQISETTYCARNIMEVLNKVDPNLVDKGRHILPKTLEAGLRAATELPSVEEVEEDEDEFLDFDSAQPQAAFNLYILPRSGKQFLKNLLAKIDLEIKRLETIKHPNSAQLEKLADIKSIYNVYTDKKLQTYSVQGQVREGCRLLAKLMPVLERQTGWFPKPFGPTSYQNIRAFARSQGIFDGDIRKAQAELKHQAAATNTPVRAADIETVLRVKPILERLTLPTAEKRHIVLCDWSFFQWTQEKVDEKYAMLKKALEDGNKLYVAEEGRLVEYNIHQLNEAFNDFNLDFPAKLKPVSHVDILRQTQALGIADEKVELLDFLACRQDGDDGLPSLVERAGQLFCEKVTAYAIKQAKLNLLNKEKLNHTEGTTISNELSELTTAIEKQTVSRGKYLTGVDTKLSFQHQSSIPQTFKSLGWTMRKAVTNYYRAEVYTSLTCNEFPNNRFDYFQLNGMEIKEEEVTPLTDISLYTGTLPKSKLKERARSSDLYMEANHTMQLSREWQALPSLHAEEILTDFSIAGITPEQIEIIKNRNNNLHYIRLKEDRPTVAVTLNYLLKMPSNFRAQPVLNTLLTNPKHKEIYDLMQKYYHYGQEPERLEEATVACANGNTYLAKARELQTGSCRLRAIAFKEEMQRLHPDISVNVIVNHQHSYIEMKLDDHWTRYCLGGYGPNLFSSAEFTNSCARPQICHA